MIDSKKKKAKPKRGRPLGSRTTFIGKAIGLRLYPDLEKRVDAWMMREPDLSRPEALRRLIELGLDASESAAKPRRPAAKPSGGKG
jgi:hypothetical protein